ncbi:MAG: HEPN domain-containing protein [bacterium]
MPSNAYSNVLLVLLEDAAELDDAHRELRTGQAGRQWRLGAINRAAVVMCLSAWEAYIEDVVVEAINSFQPAQPHPTRWQSLNADARGQIGRFNTPNVENVRRLVADTLGLQDVDQAWHWQNTTVIQARNRLTEAITFRHHVAHGVNPRPTIHNQYTHRLPGFFRRLDRATVDAVRDYLVNVLLVPNPWPA